MAKPSAQKVKIAATSDLHGFLDGLEEDLAALQPDILVIAGDMHPCRLNINADRWFREEFFPLINRLFPIQVVAIPGNHDFWINKLLQHRHLGWLKCRGEIPTNFHLLCDSGIVLKGIDFYGTPWVPWISGKWCWEASDCSLDYVFSKIPGGVDVLISHSPPCLNHKFVDISMDNDKRLWRHFGSNELTRAIVDKKPKIVLCGHIHSGRHGGENIMDSDGKKIISRCYNVSRLNERYEVSYNLEMIELPAKDPLEK